MRIEFVAGELGEMLDVLKRDGPAAGPKRVADRELAHLAPERVTLDHMPMPEAAPVTIAILPWSLPILLLIAMPRNNW